MRSKHPHGRFGAHICKVPPALPLLRADLGLTLVQSGFIATMFYVMGSVVGVFVGAVVDRYGQKRFALIGLACMCAGGLYGVFVHDYAGLLISRFVEGVGFMLFTVAGAPLLTACRIASPRLTRMCPHQKCSAPGLRPLLRQHRPERF